MVSVAGRRVPAAKVGPPALPTGFVPRDHLSALVEAAAATAPVTTLRAHAGAGKTLLLADWARTSAVATAWVSLDPTDDRPGAPPRRGGPRRRRLRARPRRRPRRSLTGRPRRPADHRASAHRARHAPGRGPARPRRRPGAHRPRGARRARDDDPLPAGPPPPGPVRADPAAGRPWPACVWRVASSTCPATGCASPSRRRRRSCRGAGPGCRRARWRGRTS